jgi:hypothetical protein
MPETLDDADLAAIEARLREYQDARASGGKPETRARYHRAKGEFDWCAEDDIARLLAEVRRLRGRG